EALEPRRQRHAAGGERLHGRDREALIRRDVQQQVVRRVEAGHVVGIDEAAEVDEIAQPELVQAPRERLASRTISRNRQPELVAAMPSRTSMYGSRCSRNSSSGKSAWKTSTIVQ